MILLDVVAAAAERAGCDWIPTRNIRDFAPLPVPAITPLEYFQKG